jgi:hypothetical protein
MRPVPMLCPKPYAAKKPIRDIGGLISEVTRIGPAEFCVDLLPAGLKAHGPEFGGHFLLGL